MSDDDERPDERDAGPRHAGQLYLLRPGPDGDGVGPGVLVLHSWWGLTPQVKAYCERLCDEGFVVAAPYLLDGRLPETAAEAELELAEIDPNRSAGLVLSSAAAVRALTDDPAGPISVVGFSMGASWALWAATRQPETFSTVVAFYGTQTIDFTDLRARVQGHFAEDDHLVDADDVVALEADLFELGLEPEVWHYPGVGHWFAEEGAGDAFDQDAAALAWERTLDFLRVDRSHQS